MAMVSAKVMATRPSSRGSLPISAPFETAIRSSGATRVTPNEALKSGSSQHGKARRASVASNWVVAMTWRFPSLSVNVDR